MCGVKVVHPGCATTGEGGGVIPHTVEERGRHTKQGEGAFWGDTSVRAMLRGLQDGDVEDSIDLLGGGKEGCQGMDYGLTC